MSVVLFWDRIVAMETQLLAIAASLGLRAKLQRLQIGRRYGRPGQAAPRQPDPPVALFAVDVEQIVLRRRVLAARRLPGGSDTDHRNPGAAPADEEQRRQMRMAVQHEFGAVPVNDLVEAGDAEQPLVLRDGAAHRRMVDHDHAKQPAFGRGVEHFAEPFRLTFHERSRWP